MSPGSVAVRSPRLEAKSSLPSVRVGLGVGAAAVGGAVTVGDGAGEGVTWDVGATGAGAAGPQALRTKANNATSAHTDRAHGVCLGGNARKHSDFIGVSSL